jgi:hypothetical protein
LAQQPHDKSGQKCHFYKKCKTVFTAQSMTLNITVKEKGLIVKHLVCAECFNRHHEKGE